MFPARQDVLFKGVGEAEGLIPGIILLQQQPGAGRHVYLPGLPARPLAHLPSPLLLCSSHPARAVKRAQYQVHQSPTHPLPCQLSFPTELLYLLIT